MPADELDRVVADLEHGTTPKSKILRELRVQRADAIEPTKISWLWKDWIPASRLALFGGKPGDGKSTVVLDLAARLSTASPMPDGFRPTKAINVAILSAEDGASDTIIPRLIAAGADRSRIYIVGGIINDIGLERPWILPDDILELSAFIRANDIRLLVIDPLSAFQSANVDTHRDGAVRAMLLPLSNMANDLHCAVVAVRHHRKGGAADARDAGSGSIAFTAAARIEWTAGTDPQDGTRRILAIAKSNIAAIPSSIAYRLVQDEQWETNRVQWDGSSDVTANQLSGEQQTDEERSEVDEAAEFILDTLGDGPIAAKAIKGLAEKAGIQYASLRRAKQRIKVHSRKTSEGTWIWELKQGAQAKKQGAHETSHSPLTHLEPLAHLPSTHTLFNEGFTREGDQGVQGAQGAVSLSVEHLPYSEDYPGSLSDECEDDELVENDRSDYWESAPEEEREEWVPHSDDDAPPEFESEFEGDLF